MNSNLLKIAMTLTLAMPMWGCVTQHSKNKSAAVDRWTAARTGISYGLAVQQFETGELDKAARTINQTLDVKPDNARFNVLAARIAMEQGELERAYRHLEIAINADPAYAEAHYYLGVVLQRWQQYDKAYEAYDMAYRTHPDEVAPLLAVAEMLVKLDRDDEAVARLQAKLVYFEHNAAMRLSIARILMKQRKLEPALSMFREAYMLQPDNPMVLEQLAMAEYAAGKFGEAILHLKQLMESPDYADRRDLRKALADCYQSTNQAQRARLIYLDLTRSQPTDVDAWIGLGQVAWIVGDMSRVRTAARQVVSLAPDRHEGYLLVGLFAQHAGRVDQAVRQFERAAELAPESALPHILKGVAQEQQGNRAAASKSYAAALKINPKDQRARQLLAGLDVPTP
jgi:tetratricopeptide (TPR) repeat protein